MEQGRPELASIVGYRLKQAEAVLRARMDAALRPLGLSTPQYACLELLSRTPGASNSDLARGAFVTRQTMSALVRGLQRRGLVERATRPTVGRTLPTSLTPDGEELLTRAAAVIGRIEDQMVSRLGDEERAGLHRALTGLIEALAPEGTPPPSPL